MATGFSRLKPALIRATLLAYVAGVPISSAQAQDPLSRFLDDIFKPQVTMPEPIPSFEPEMDQPAENMQTQSQAEFRQEETVPQSSLPPPRPTSSTRAEAPVGITSDNAVGKVSASQPVAQSQPQLQIIPPLPPARPAGIGEVASDSVSTTVVKQIAPAVSPVLAPIPVQAPATQVAQANPVPRNASEAVARLNSYLNEINTLTARFLQTGADRRQVGGTLYVQRPGKMRFAYDPPSTLEIVADGRSVAVRDAKLRTNDVYSIGQTPLKFLLRDNVDLSRDVKVRDVDIDSRGSVELKLEDSATLGGTSTVTLRFDARANVLREWIIVDPQGYETTVTLSDVQVVKR